MEIRTKAVVFYDEGIRSAKEIGETYNISERTVRRWANRARLRHLFLHSGTVRLYGGFPDQNPAIGAQIGLVFPHPNSTPIRWQLADKKQPKN